MLSANSINQWQQFLDPAKRFPIIRTFGVTNVLGPSLRLFTSHLWLITKMVFVVVAPFEIFKVLNLANPLDEFHLRLQAFLLGALCHLLIAPALIYALMRIMHTGVAPGVHESYRWGLTRLGKLVVCAAIAYFLQGLGYVFLIIPGIMISLTLAVVYPVAVLEQRSVSDVLRRSSQLTRGYRFEILGAQLVMWLMTFMITGPLGLISQNVTFWPLVVLAAIVEDVIQQASLVLTLVMYLSLLRTHQPSRPIVSLTS